MHQQDLQHADCIVIEGSNMAECHPVGFQWIMEAKARGATLIHVDPRLTRTGALADLHVPIRVGTDIALLGGLINYVLSNGLELRDYVVAYTNAATILREDFRDTEDLDGIFSGWQDETASYQTDSWQYEGARVAGSAGQREQGTEAEEPGRAPAHRRHPTRRGARARARQPRRVTGGSAPDRAGRDPGAPAVCLSGPQTPLQPVHPGNG